MNKRKIVIFVEGQTEQQFIRDVLYVWYGYDTNRVGIFCHQLRSSNLYSVPFDVGSEESESFYRIVDACGEGTVLSAIRKNANRYANLGYEAVIGLRDMFCDAYHSVAKDRCIHIEINEKMIQLTKAQLPQDSKISHICFAIMEIETWILSMPELLQRIDERFTAENVLQKFNVNISADLEQTLYHPAQTVTDLLRWAGKNYDKHKDEISSITSQIQKTDCISLLNSGRCKAFNSFMTLVLKDDLIIQ